MENHSWEVILALSGTISTLAGGIIRYLLKELSDAKDALKKKPGFIIEKAVKRMLPKNRTGLKMIKRLKGYAGAEHPHQAQKPVEITV